MGNNTFQVLVVEDNFTDARFVLDALKETIFDAVWVRRISEAVEYLSSGDHQTHAVLLDIGLPDSQGLGVVGEICKFGVPVIVMSGLLDDAMSLEVVEIGAQDAIKKGTVTKDVLARILHYSLIRFLNDKTNRIHEKLDNIEGLLQCLRTG